MKYLKSIKLVLDGYISDMKNELVTLTTKRAVVFDDCLLTLLDEYEFVRMDITDFFRNNYISYESDALLYREGIFEEIDKVVKR